MVNRVLVLACLAGCNSIIGTRDVQFEASPAAADGGVVPADAAPKTEDAGMMSMCPGKDLEVDPNNCGRCAHSCLGGACTAGVCGPTSLATIPGVLSLALSQSDVFFASERQGALFRVAKTGGMVTEIAKCGGCSGVALDGTSVFAVGLNFDPQPIVCPLAGTCNVQTRGKGEFVRDIAVTGADIVFTAQEGVTLAKPNGDQTILVAPTTPWRIAADATHAYYTSAASTFRRVPLTGGPSEEVGPAPGDLIMGGTRIVGTRVYWTSGSDRSTDGIVASKGTNLADGVVYAPNKSGVGATGITADATHVYWVTFGGGAAVGAGALHRCPIAGCSTPETILKNLTAPVDVHVDDLAIYVGHQDGVLRIAKP